MAKFKITYNELQKQGLSSSEEGIHYPTEEIILEGKLVEKGEIEEIVIKGNDEHDWTLGEVRAEVESNIYDFKLLVKLAEKISKTTQ